MNLKILDTGYCQSIEKIAIKGGRFKKIQFPSIAGVIKHPKHGIILFDTGYSSRLFEASQKFPARLYSIILPPVPNSINSVIDQLSDMGIGAEEVQYIIVSHFHADHSCGLKDFPNARFICSSAAFNHLVSLKNEFQAVKEAILLDLIPSDIEDKIWLIDEDTTISQIHDQHLGILYDIFGDKSVLINDLPGHLTGQIGAIINANNNQYFLIADACWLSESYKHNILPSSIARLIISDFNAYKQTIQKIHLFHKANKLTHIIPTHCSKTVKHHVLETQNF